MHRAVVAYAVLWVLLDLVALLPGDSMSFSSGWGLVVSVLIQGLIVWRLARGSALAWTIGLLMALGAVAALFLMAAPFEVAVALVVVLCLAQAGILLTPPMLVWPRRQPPPASA